MSEKAAKRERKEAEQQANDVLFTVTIDMMRNGIPRVAGPITDPILMMDVFGKALQ